MAAHFYTLFECTEAHKKRHPPQMAIQAESRLDLLRPPCSMIGCAALRQAMER